MRLITVLIIVILISCTSKKSSDSETIEKSYDTSFVYSADSTMLKFTAYKFTEKLGVSGLFDKHSITKTNTAKNPYKVFKDSEFIIETNSINTANPARDQTIITHFFNHFKNKAVISGKVISISEKGIGQFKVSLNGIEKEVNFECTFDDKNIHFNSEINLEDFQGQAAIASLNEVCKANHIGADGILKLWPTVKLYLKVNVR